jgi:hypothetical protein
MLAELKCGQEPPPPFFLNTHPSLKSLRSQCRAEASFLCMFTRVEYTESSARPQGVGLSTPAFDSRAVKPVPRTSAVVAYRCIQILSTRRTQPPVGSRPPITIAKEVPPFATTTLATHRPARGPSASATSGAHRAPRYSPATGAANRAKPPPRSRRCVRSLCGQFSGSSSHS